VGEVRSALAIDRYANARMTSLFIGFWPQERRPNDHRVGRLQAEQASVEQLRVVTDLEQRIANQAPTDMPTRHRW